LQNFNPDVKERASIYVPAIGKVTIVMLLRNLVRLVQNRPRQSAVEANGVETA
jgi:methylenetetrahydrofolate dehydrogenase (NAD+)